MNGIIVEGADKQFKTTICRKLQEKLNLPIIHFSADFSDFDYCKGYYKDILRYDTGIIYDRNYISELVYGPVVRNKCHITETKKAQIENIFNKFKYFVVFLQIADDVFNYEDDLFDMKTRSLIKGQYNKVFNSINLEKYKFDPSKCNIVEDIIAIWKRNNEES